MLQLNNVSLPSLPAIYGTSQIVETRNFLVFGPLGSFDFVKTNSLTVSTGSNYHNLWGSGQFLPPQVEGPGRADTVKIGGLENRPKAAEARTWGIMGAQSCQGSGLPHLFIS